MADDNGKPAPATDDLAAALPGLARVAASTLWRTAEWAATSWTSTTRNVLTAVMNGQAPATIIRDTANDVRALVRDALGTDSNDPRERVVTETRPGTTSDELRAKARRLLRDSADVWYREDTHPAYAAILEELTPDEARILRFLYTEGPQPSVDVRTNRPLGRGSEKVAAGLSMVGLHAGVRNPEWTNVHLGNLNRLGLVDFPHEEVANSAIYQVLEVQPDVQAAMKRAGRSPKMVHRSIELTIFGVAFCRICFSVDDTT